MGKAKITNKKKKELENLRNAILNVLPEGTTNGDLIQSLFPEIEFGTRPCDEELIVNRSYSNNEDVDISIPKRIWDDEYGRRERIRADIEAKMKELAAKYHKGEKR